MSPLTLSDIRARLGWRNSLAAPVWRALGRPGQRARVTRELAIWLVGKHGQGRAERWWAAVGGSSGLRVGREGELVPIWVVLTGEQLFDLLWLLPVLEEPRFERRGRPGRARGSSPRGADSIAAAANGLALHQLRAVNASIENFFGFRGEPAETRAHG